MKTKFFIFYFLFFILPAPVCALETPQPAWGPHGMLINDAPGNTTQQNPHIISDGHGNYIVVWEDGRSGYYNLYAQKFAESGRLLWNTEGVAVSKCSGNQNFAQITSDRAGGAIIVWQDYRNGNADIYAQRMGSSGQLLWGEGGKAVCPAPAGQFAPDIIPDDAGGAAIAWHDYRSGAGEDIYAQRIDSQGKPLWQENGIPVSAAKGTQWYPKIASDGAGGVIIVWTDGRISANNNDIYAQRISPAGKILWEENGKAVSSAAHNQEYPAILSSEYGVIVAWNDSRSGNIDIYAQKVDLNGSLLWGEEGTAVCSAPFSQENPKLTSDGSGGAILAWTDERVEPSDIYGQRIYKDGRKAWQANGRPICKANGKQKNPEIVSLINNEWEIVWEDHRQEDNPDLFAQKINSAGTPLWQENGIRVAHALRSQVSPALKAAPSGNLLVVWQDCRFGNYDLYAQNVSSDGNTLWGKSGALICSAQGSVVQQNVELINNEKNEIVLVFEDARSGFFNIYAQKINKSGQLAWGKDGTPVAKAVANQSSPCLVPDGTGGAIIAWEDSRLPALPAIRAQRINSLGQKVWESSLLVSNIKSRQIRPAMISDGKNGAIIVWQDNRDPLDLQNIYAQRISPQGKLLWGKGGKVVIAEAGDQTDIDVISDGMGGAFLAWTDYRSSDRNPDIYAQRISAKGEPLWQEDGIQICGAPDVQRAPKLAGNGEGGVLVAWTDKGGGSYDIYAQRISKTGQTYWITDGIPINQLSRTQQNPKFAKKKVLVWEDYRLGNWDIFAAAVDPSGKLPWSEKGIPIASLPHTQYAPQIILWKNESVIIAWEDYRSGSFYEIFAQKLNQEGQAAWVPNGIKIQSKDGGRTPKIAANLSDNSFYVFWEDYSDGGRAIYGQKFLIE